MLVTASRSGEIDYPYNTVTVVLITEVLKLVLSGSIYMRDNTAVSLGENILENKNVLGLYFVPAALYCLYNNLSFVSLSYFNPTTYFMFMQIRLLLTGLIYQVGSRKDIYDALPGAKKTLNTGPSTRFSSQRSLAASNGAPSFSSLLGESSFSSILSSVSSEHHIADVCLLGA